MLGNTYRFGQDAEWVTANFTNATEILAVGYPQWVDAQIGEGLTNGLYKFTATIGDHELNSYLDGLTYGTNSTPQVHLSLDFPDAVLLNSNVVSVAKVAAAGWSFWSDAPTSGVVRVFCVSGADKVLAPGLVGEWTVDDSYSVAATLEGVGTSAAFGDVVFRMEFCGGDGQLSQNLARASFSGSCENGKLYGNKPKRKQI